MPISAPPCQNADQQLHRPHAEQRRHARHGKPVNADAEVAKGRKPAATKKAAAAGLTGSRMRSPARIAASLLPCLAARRAAIRRPRQAVRSRRRQSAPDRQQDLPVRAAERHAGAGDPRSPRAGGHPDAVVQGGRGGRSARHFGPGPFLRAYDVPRHQDRCRAMPSPRPSRRMAARTTPSPPTTTPPSTSRSPRTGCRWRWSWRPTAWPIWICPIPMSRPSAMWCWKSAACGWTTIPRR